MPANLNPTNPLQPLSVGNVVSAGLRLYRSHLKLYLGLAFTALFWSFLPVYGWAKAQTINALIARLAYSELINQPETVREIRTAINHRLWSFLGTQVLSFLMMIGVNIGISLISQVLLIIPLAITRQQTNNFSGLVFVIYQVILTLAGWGVYLWFLSRIFIPELPLAVENNVSAGQAIERSWSLTKGSVLRIQLIILIAYLITLPLIFCAFLPFLSILPAFIVNPNQDNIIFVFLITLVLAIILSALFGTFLNPFWQAIKAVIYYDLRNRQEGLGIKLRDHNI